MKRTLGVLLALSSLLQAGASGSKVRYIGGTVGDLPNKAEVRINLALDDAIQFKFHSNSLKIPYQDVNTLEYGQRVSRRYVEAVFVSPIFLMGKKRSHYLTIGYTDDKGQQQALVLQVDKDDIRSLLAGLEAKTGRRVEYQDEESRKSGKG